MQELVQDCLGFDVGQEAQLAMDELRTIWKKRGTLKEDQVNASKRLKDQIIRDIHQFVSEERDKLAQMERRLREIVSEAGTLQKVLGLHAILVSCNKTPILIAKG